MLRSIKYLARVVASGSGKCVDTVLSKVEEAEQVRLDSGRPVSSHVHIQHSRLRAAIEAQSVDIAHSALDRLADEVFFSEEVRYGILGGSPWSPMQSGFVLEVLNQSSLTTYGQSMVLHEPMGSKVVRTMSAAERMLDVLNEIDPELYRETAALVTDIVFFDSPTTISGSSFNSLGLVGMNCLHDNQNWTTLLEMLVHESAHQYVFNVMIREKVLDCDSPPIHRSAFRRDLRPMSGIFHALIVVARIIYLMSKLSVYVAGRDEKIVPPPNNARNTAPYKSKFSDLLAVVEQHAELTPIGLQLVEGSKELAQLPILDEAFA